MKHAFSVALILSLGGLGAGLAGCAADHEADRQEYAYGSGWSPGPRKSASLKPDGITTGSLQPIAAAEKTSETFKLSPEQMQRHERRVYAQGLEKILVSNGMGVSVMVYEGQVGTSPTLMFFGHFTKEFVARALTSGAVLKRAKELGFKSVDFFDRGPEGHYQFVVSKTAPLPKCAAYQRLCL
jgi:hypothetical protein